MSRLLTFTLLTGIGPVVTTGEAAVTLRVSRSAASRTLLRLAGEGQAIRLRPGYWSIGPRRPDPFAIVTDITRPHPSYVSYVSALAHLGLIDQVPRDITVASMGRARRIPTTVGTFVVHRLPPELFGGWEMTPRGPVASPEKAIFDICYAGAARGGRPPRTPELELPLGFDAARFEGWLEMIPAPRLRTLTRRALGYALGRAIR